MKPNALPLLASILLSICWGYNWVFLKIGLLDAGPFSFLALRMTLSSVCLLAILPITGRPLVPGRVPELVLLGLVQTSAVIGLAMWALVEGGAGRMAFLVNAMPFWALLLAWPLLGERIRGWQWLAALLAACGLCAILQPWALSGPVASKLMAVAAGAAWAAGAIMVKRIQKRGPIDLLSMTAWQMVFGTLPLLALGWLIVEPPVVWSNRFITMLLVTSLVMTSFCWLLWVYVLKHLPAGIASLSTLAIPVVAILSSSFHLGERPDPIEWWGMGLITVALMLLAHQVLQEHRVAGGACRERNGS